VAWGPSGRCAGGEVHEQGVQNTGDVRQGAWDGRRNREVVRNVT
jgi:hypothetical protein